MSRTLITAILFAGALVLFGCGKAEKKKTEAGVHDHGQGKAAKHGGSVIEVGDHIAHIEFVHDRNEGKVTLYISGKELGEAMAIADAPKVKIKTESGPKVLETKGEDTKDGQSSTFSVNDDALKTDPLEGSIAIKIGDKEFHPDIKDSADHKQSQDDGHDHGHDHGQEKDDGHDHGEDKEHQH